MRKKCIAVLSAVAGIALALLTLASYIHYETNLPIVSTVSPEKVYEEGTDDYRTVKVPAACMEVGGLYTVEIRKGLFEEEYYLAIPEQLEIIDTDDAYIYVKAGPLLPNDFVVLSASKEVAAGDVVKLQYS